MHLARGLSTISTKKPKQKKLTQAQLEKMQVQWRQHNKDMRRQSLHSLQFANFDDYLAYRQGKLKFTKTRQEFEPWQPSTSYHRETAKIPSLGDGVGNGLRKESQRYTGTLIKGIATMHKSNAVPIIDEKQAIEIAHMRRN